MEHAVTTALPRPNRIDAVIFDFDSTLFDTEKKKHGFYEIAECHGYTRREAKDMYDQSRAQGNRMMISIAGFLSVLRESLTQSGKEFQSKEVSNIIDQMNKGVGLLPGAKALLEFSKRREMPMMLLSLGVREWQEEKVNKSGVDRCFATEDIVYTDILDTGKIDIIRERFGKDFDGVGVVLFNDKPDETADILRAFPKMFAYVRREVRDDRYTEEDFSSFQAAFPDRVVYADDLQFLRGLFQSAWEASHRTPSGKQWIFDISFLDFDNTLYDTHTLDMLVREAFLRYGVGAEDHDRAFFLALHGETGGYFNYSIDLHIKNIQDLGYDIPTDLIRSEVTALFDGVHQFEDAEAFLQCLRDRSRIIVLLTAGDEATQRRKLSMTTLAPFFDEVVILHEKKETVVERIAGRSARSLFVNDDVAQNMLIQKKFPRVLVLTKRHPVKYTDEELRASGIPYFSTLADMQTYVERIAF